MFRVDVGAAGPQTQPPLRGARAVAKHGLDKLRGMNIAP